MFSEAECNVLALSGPSRGAELSLSQSLSGGRGVLCSGLYLEDGDMEVSDVQWSSAFRTTGQTRLRDRQRQR